MVDSILYEYVQYSTSSALQWNSDMGCAGGGGGGGDHSLVNSLANKYGRCM